MIHSNPVPLVPGLYDGLPSPSTRRRRRPFEVSLRNKRTRIYRNCFRSRRVCNLSRSVRGVATIEALASLAVMAVLLAVVGQWSTAMMQHRRSIARRRAAMQATDNVIALATAANFADVTTESLLALSESYTPKRAKWDIRVEPIAIAGMDKAEGKRIVVALTFENSSLYVRPLVAWKYPTQSEGPRDE